MVRCGLSLLLVLLMLMPRICTCAATEAATPTNAPQVQRTDTIPTKHGCNHQHHQPKSADEEPAAPMTPTDKHAPHDHDPDCQFVAAPIGVAPSTTILANDAPGGDGILLADLWQTKPTHFLRSRAPAEIPPTAPRYLAFLTLLI